MHPQGSSLSSSLYVANDEELGMIALNVTISGMVITGPPAEEAREASADNHIVAQPSPTNVEIKESYNKRSAYPLLSRSLMRDG